MIIRYFARYFPGARHQIRVAHLNESVEDLLKRVLIRTVMYVLLLGMGLAMLFDKQGINFALLPLILLFIFAFGVWFGMKQPTIAAHRRSIDIDREVLFAGRFLLVKLHSGKPLVNALMEASESYGVASRYFREIVRDIELGTPLEDAIEKAMTYSASESWRKILFQIHNALRLGIDVTQSLEAVLEDITQAQLLEIQKYGKKLPSATLFYMLAAIVFPSLGMTMLTVVMAFLDFQIGMTGYAVVIFLLIIMNFIFITVFRGIRPKVNI